jgi:hypothetical protein
VVGLGWLLVALQYAQTKNKIKNEAVIAAIKKQLANKATETADTASFTTSYGDDGTLVMLHSERRTDAVPLSLFAHVPDSEAPLRLCWTRSWTSTLRTLSFQRS